MSITRPSTLPFKAYYFFLFTGPALVSTYLSLYLKRSGQTDAQIGILFGIQAVMGIVSPPIWGALSDWLGTRRLPGMLLMVMTGILFPCFYWVHGFSGLFVIALLFGFFTNPIVPLADAVTIAHLRRWQGDFGRIRVWGSIGYVVVLTVLTPILPRTSGSSASVLAPVFLLFVIGRLAGLLSVSQIPDEPEEAKEKAGPGSTLRSAAGLFLNRRMALFTLCAFLSWGAMQAYYTFFSIYLDSVGVSDSFKGLFGNVAVLSEIVFLTQAGKVREKVGSYTLLSIGLGAAVLRLELYALHAPLWLIGVSQLLHAATFGAFYIACISFLTEAVPDRLRASGQTLFMGLVTGMGGAIGAWGAGLIAHRWGIPYLFAVYARVALGGLLISLYLGYRSPHRSPDSGGSKR